MACLIAVNTYNVDLNSLFCLIYLSTQLCLLFNSIARVSKNMINLEGHLIM